VTALDGKVILVTGATDGMGRALASRANDQAYNADARLRLRTLSQQLTGL
jgi:NAD(P)-dependent dehydrogenase (short-subunit alcohol dehydrogenase family)